MQQTLKIRDFESYRDLLLASELLTLDALETVIADFTRENGVKRLEPRAFGQFLVQARLLTNWQHNYLLRGYSGFNLGPYVLLRGLGAGGASRVFLAKHKTLQRAVALKVLPKSRCVEEVALQRFFQESRAHATLKHANVVRAYEFGTEGNVHFLAMEYVNGPDLHKLVRKQGPLAPEVAADYIRQAAAGLHYVHDRKFIHRDIKPANLLVSSQGVVKISDLGVVRLVEAEGERLTVVGAGVILGTLDYLAPEQAIDPHTVDVRADVYSLGCTLYYLLTGNPPFIGGPPAQRLLMHQMMEPPPIRSLRPEIPLSLTEICRRMMAKKTSQRYQNAVAVQETLARWLEKFRRGEERATPEAHVDTSETSVETLQGSKQATMVVGGGPRSRDLSFRLCWEGPFTNFPPDPDPTAST